MVCVCVCVCVVCGVCVCVWCVCFCVVLWCVCVCVNQNAKTKGVCHKLCAHFGALLALATPLISLFCVGSIITMCIKVSEIVLILLNKVQNQNEL